MGRKDMNALTGARDTLCSRSVSAEPMIGQGVGKLFDSGGNSSTYCLEAPVILRIPELRTPRHQADCKPQNVMSHVLTQDAGFARMAWSPAS
jgi:hypothetical protein